MGRFLALTALSATTLLAGWVGWSLTGWGLTPSMRSAPLQATVPSDQLRLALFRSPRPEVGLHSPFYPLSAEVSSTPRLERISAIPVPAEGWADADRFQQIMHRARPLAQHPIADVMQAIAEELLDSRYQEHLLDQTESETLVTSLRQFDCVLFVETVLALSRGVVAQDYTQDTFAAHLEDQRYRQGRLQNYCSRLHYWSEWIADNQARGTVQNITAALGGEPLPKTLNFISRHRQSYPKLVHDEALFACIQQMEAGLQDLKIDYIPTQKIAAIYPQLRSGDIVAIATNIPGLDVTHTGLAYRQANGRFGLIHASPIGAVVIAPDLQAYTERVERSVGIIVARPMDRRSVDRRSHEFHN
jgi:hypothetical protein